jgi:Mitochondrial carrier protein
VCKYVITFSFTDASNASSYTAGAFVSHPADLILTKTSASKRKAASLDDETNTEEKENSGPSWLVVVKDLLSQDGGISNLFVGLGSRSIFFFLVIGLQFFLYDYVKNLFQVSSDDLSLVLDVFYAVRAGLVGMGS